VAAAWPKPWRKLLFLRDNSGRFLFSQALPASSHVRKDRTWQQHAKLFQLTSRCNLARIWLRPWWNHWNFGELFKFGAVQWPRVARNDFWTCGRCRKTATTSKPVAKHKIGAILLVSTSVLAGGS